MIADSVSIHKRDSNHVDLVRKCAISLKDHMMVIESSTHDRIMIAEPKILFIYEGRMIFSGFIKGTTGYVDVIRLEVKL